MNEQIQSSKRGRPSRKAVYQHFDEQIAELWQRLGGLPSPTEASEIWKGIWLEEAHNSTAIEGNTLVLKEVQTLLAEGRAVGNKELRDYMEVKGYADAADWVYRQAMQPGAWNDGSLLTITEIRAVHAMAMTPVWDVAPHEQATERESPGRFREHDIYPFPDGMTPPSWVEVPSAMTDWVREVRRLEARQTDFPERLAELHCRFEQAHPFLDGNGRTGRLLLNLLLVRLGYPPVVIYKRQRTAYLKALRRADAGDFGPMGELIARSVLDNLHRFVVPAIAGPLRLVPLTALETKEVKSSALRTAAIRGRLQAVRGPDGKWRSCRQWVDDYVDQKYKRE